MCIPVAFVPSVMFHWTFISSLDKLIKNNYLFNGISTECKSNNIKNIQYNKKYAAFITID